MTFARWTGSSWQAFTTYRRWDGSVWQFINQARRWNGSSWVVFGFLSASLAPTGLSGTRTTPGTAITSGSCTCTPLNGSGSYTYLWVITQGIGLTVSAASPTSATTIFQATVNGGNDTATATAVCQVTDTVSGLVVNTSNSVGITLTFAP